MDRYRKILQHFRSRGKYLCGSMLGLAACWICLNLLRDDLPISSTTLVAFASRNFATVMVAALGALLWATATWQRLYSLAASNWVAAGCTAGLAFMWANLFRFQMWPLLAFCLIVVGPTPLAIPKGDSNKTEGQPEIIE